MDMDNLSNYPHLMLFSSTFDCMPPVPTRDLVPNFTPSLSDGQYVCNSLDPSKPGGPVYTPSTSDMSTMRSAFISADSKAARLSLSLTVMSCEDDISSFLITQFL